MREEGRPAEPALAWAFQTNQSQAIKATPILANGVMYVATDKLLYALQKKN